MKSSRIIFFATVLLLSSFMLTAQNQNTIEIVANEQQQIIDGFGAHQGNNVVNQQWWIDLFFEDMQASIYRVDLTPKLVSPYSDLSYVSPWFMGNDNDHPLNIEFPGNETGPEGNRVRTYTSPEDYGRDFAGFSAPIAVMGPDIDVNVAYFTYSEDNAITEGMARSEELGDFKFIASIWSPLPWVKVSSGNHYPENWSPGPVEGTAWPFVWGGNFAGGRLDVTNEPLDVFDDSDLGGEGATSSLTQFARSTAAYIKGYQDFHNTQFYAISIQNELNFEEFYNSATYPLSQQYIAALLAIKNEFDKYDDLRDIKIIGPEDLLGGDAYGLWQYGGGENTIHKNLQYLSSLAENSEASDAVDFFCIHGYDRDGASASGATSILWDYWLNGWDASPASGIPANVNGFAHYGKKSWMTETSGEDPRWLYPTSGYPSGGAWSLGLRVHQALTSGRQSAWVYWTFADLSSGNPGPDGLTTPGLGNVSPKYVAAKHYFRYIRPNAYRVTCNTAGEGNVLGSAYTHEGDSTITIVVINPSDTEQLANINLQGLENENIDFETYTSSNNNYWESSALSLQEGNAEISLPPYSMMTLYSTTSAIVTDVNEIKGKSSIALFQNNPNPFSETTTVSFELTKKENIRVTLHDTQGRILDTLMDESKTPGAYQLEIDATQLPDGMYLCQLESGAFKQVLKLIVTKGMD